MPDDRVSALAEKLASLNFKPGPRQSVPGAAKPQGLDASTKSVNEANPATEGAAVRVAVRFRPPSGQSEKTFEIACENSAQDKVTLKLEAPEEKQISGPRMFRCNKFYGPGAAQEDIFEQAAPIVSGTMEGYNGTIFCYGITGSGKTYTMTGPPEDIGNDRDSPTAGIVQRVSRRMFEYIRDRSPQGEVFVVEASFLEIYSHDGTHEQLIDLLADDDKKLEVKQDPLNSQSFVCDNLRRVPIRTPDEMCEVLNLGQQRCKFLETNRNFLSSRSHCLFMLSIESMVERKGGSEPVVQRGKLMLVDLAGSESLKKIQADADANEDLRRRQAIGINRVLASLGTIGNNVNTGVGPGQRDSALTMLLKDCLGGNARALLIANVGPELDNVDEAVKTMAFAQKMMSVRNRANVNRIDQEHSSLLQMRHRHSECIKLLQEKVNDEHAVEQEERKKLQQEMEDLNTRLLTKESAEETLETMRDHQFRKIDEMKEEMTFSMSKELDKMRQQSLMDLDNLRKSVEQHVSHLDSSHHQRNAEEHEVRVGKLQSEVSDALQMQRSAEEEASDLRVRLASAEERAKMLQDRQEELKRERSTFEDERRSLRTQSDQQWQKLSTVEGELQRFKAEADVQRAELARLNSARAGDAETLRKEREAFRAREAEYQQEIAELSRQLDEAQREAEVQALRAECEQRETLAQLRLQVERLEAEAATRAEQLGQAQQAQAQLTAEKVAAKQREEALKQQVILESRQYQEELEELKSREAELMHMLNEVQDSIITASATQPPGPP
mmetsp:Transcript_102480/g.298931  ORF Transcript_102480/g.298931 Transcript_102480/m.298931 type:complete len:783 (-) Transcript_102480:221-2569(-)